jgi:5-methylcytosine-specific restriction endonuclease McrA
VARWYNSPRWRKLRARHLRSQPYCQCPEHKGLFVEGDTVDHVRPHRGNSRLFWDNRNLQTLTKHCHDSWKQSEERRDLMGCSEDGEPNDPRHHWNQ